MFKPEKKDNPESAFLRARVGMGYLNQGKNAQALSALLEAQKLDPQNPVYKNYLAIAYYSLEKFDLAETYLLKALQMKPLYTDARNNLARLYIDLGRIDEALVELNTAAEDLTFANHEKVQYNFGLAYFLRGEFVKAENHLQQSLKIKKGFCPSTQLYGQTLFQAGNYARAIETLQNALSSCETQQDETRYYIGLAYFRLGQNSQAHEMLTQMLQKYPTSQFSSRARSTLKFIR